jgi:hypothetical protein
MTKLRSQSQISLKELEFLFEGYSKELRATTQPYHLARVAGNIKDYTYHPDDVLVREPLIEHVGSLPMVATALYPFINDKDVDLGQALIMLAIHDIGELITGDEMTFTKKTEAKDPEHRAALTLLHTSYHDLYNDVESQTSQSAKFAKSIDKITGDLFDYLAPAEVTVRRYKHFVGTDPDGIIDLIVNHKRPYVLWNPFLTDFHILLMERFAAKLKQ